MINALNVDRNVTVNGDLYNLVNRGNLHVLIMQISAKSTEENERKFTFFVCVSGTYWE